MIRNFSYNIETILDELRSQPEEFFWERGHKRAIELFKSSVKKVPAYKKFITKKGINKRKIKKIEDFKTLPLLDKDNYLRANDIEDLCPEGNFQRGQWTICSTSGSTGEPFYFPHSLDQDLQYAEMAETYLQTNFDVKKRSTLYINGFPMGAWIGGVFTYKAISLIAESAKYPLSIINPGINKLEILKVIKKFGHKFDQIIIGSYGPFLKDILDDGRRDGINWKKLNVGFIFSAEGFTENFRDYVLSHTRLTNKYTATLNHYGTVDLGTMSYETPLSVLIRKISLRHPNIYRGIFGEDGKLGTLTQFRPDRFYFEEVNYGLVCTADSGLPLIRYDLKDSGGIITFKNMVNIFMENGLDIYKEAKKAGIDKTVWQLPFVMVKERKDFSISFHAFQIHPATIRRALEHEPIRDHLTGKFSMFVEYDNEQNQKIIINLELSSNAKVTKSFRKEVVTTITNQLIKEISEYRETYKEKRSKVMPKIVFWPYEHQKHFRPGIKQKWVIKNA
jgi:phenylacetate-CoA ligase